MSVEFEIDDRSAFASLEGVSQRVLDRFEARLKPVEEAMLDDARSRALAHFHSVGKDPGLYLIGFSGGVKQKPSGVVGWVRNPNPLAHLFEKGFTISDWMIVPGTGRNTDSYLGAVMAFEGGVGELYAAYVHRHTTKVQPYPAIDPAFDAHKDDVRAAAEQAVEGL